MRDKIYFKNLNSLRFIAALVVLLSHVGQLIEVFGVTKEFNPVFYSPVQGNLGVILFFVLSGFLISYLLLAEIALTHTVNIKSFYIRRALRIWPLYFLTIALALFVYPFIPFLVFQNYAVPVIWTKLSLKIIFYCIFMPNIVMDFLGFIPYATHSWTIGAEEQFYFAWPVLFKKVKNKIWIFVGVLVIYLLIYHLLLYFQNGNKITKTGFLIISRYPFSCMAIGGLYAYLIFIKNDGTEKIKNIMFSVWLQWLVMAVLVFFAVKQFYFQLFNNEIYSILLGYQVCNLAANPKPIFSLENKYLNYLGKISYGLYMFHPVAIACAIKLCLLLGYASNGLLYSLTVVIAILLSALSYGLYEKYFIKKKKNHAVLLTGDNAT